MNTERIGRAVTAAVGELIDAGVCADVAELFVGTFDANRVVRFIAIGGASISGEALFRWMAGKELHVLKGDAWRDLSAGVKLWFDAFVAFSVAAMRLVEPVLMPAPIVPQPHRVRLEDTIYERHARGDERTGGPSLDPATPPTTAGVPVWTAPGAQAQERQGAAGHGVITPAMMAARGGRPIPSVGELSEMSAEERRPWAKALGFASWTDDDPITTKAPALGPGVKQEVDALVNGERITGSVAVAQADAAPTFIPSAERATYAQMQDEAARGDEESAGQNGAGPEGAANERSEHLAAAPRRKR